MTAREAHGISERRAGAILGTERSLIRYRSIRPDDAAVRARLRSLAAERRRFGYRRLGLLLAREGVRPNHEKLRRLYREEHLTVRRRGGRKRALGTRASMAVPTGPNQRWSLDFVSDTLADGRRFRMLCVVDEGTRECLGLMADTSLSGARVARELDVIAAARGWPASVVSDNGRKTALDRTEKHRQDGPDGNRGLYFLIEGSWGSGQLDTQCRSRAGHSGAGQLEVSLCGRLEPSVRFPWMEERLREGRLSEAPSRIVWVSSMTRTAASYTLAITKSVSVRPLQFGSALEQRILVARDPRLQPLISRFGHGFTGHVAHTLSCTRNVGKMYG